MCLAVQLVVLVVVFPSSFVNNTLCNIYGVWYPHRNWEPPWIQTVLHYLPTDYSMHINCIFLLISFCKTKYSTLL